MEYRILGPLEVAEEGEPVPLGRLKERLVLAVRLLHANEFVSRERLIDELWGESPPPTARKAVNVYISQLRKALTRKGLDPIATADGGYRFEIDAQELDAAHMQHLLATARERTASGELEAGGELLREALALWRGPTLAGLLLESHGRDEVEQLDELRLTALMDRIDCDLALGRHEDVLGELRVLVGEHPLRERLRAQLMLALYRADRQAEALDEYQKTRDVLVEELGIEPSPALQRLQQGILRHDLSLETASGVASPPTRVVLAEDHYLLREGMRRLLETDPGLEIAAVCEDLDSLLAAVEDERPDVVVTDIRMPPGNLDEGIRAADRIRVEHPDVGVVVLSQYLEPAYALALVEALVAEKTRREHSPLNELTPRELDVLREMAEGKNNAAIAEALRLSEGTVEKAIHSIFLKLGLAFETAVHKRVKAVIFYLSGTAAETPSAERSS